MLPPFLRSTIRTFVTSRVHAVYHPAWTTVDTWLSSTRMPARDYCWRDTRSEKTRAAGTSGATRPVLSIRITNGGPHNPLCPRPYRRKPGAKIEGLFGPKAGVSCLPHRRVSLNFSRCPTFGDGHAARSQSALFHTEAKRIDRQGPAQRGRPRRAARVAGRAERGKCPLAAAPDRLK